MTVSTRQSTGSVLASLNCASCGSEHDATVPQGTCTSCHGPLMAHYDLARLKGRFTPDHLQEREPTMWRYREVLPVFDEAYCTTMGEGFTPLFELPRLGAELGVNQLWLKDESANPGHSFKARGASAGISRARELGLKKVAVATNGNAGEAWALYGARGGVDVTVILPTDAQDSVKAGCALTGAKTLLVEGLISDGGQIIQDEACPQGWFDVSTLKEPYRLEGKKTMGYEIAEQMHWQLPDAILFPTGGGIAIAAMYKAFSEMKEMGWIEGPLPKLIAVQAEGCAPLAAAFAAGEKVSQFCEGAHTQANGLRVPKSYGDFLVLEAVYATNGCVVTAADEELLAGVAEAAASEGIMLCSEAGILIPALRKLRQNGTLSADDSVVMMGTGSAYKYHEVMKVPKLPIVKPGQPTGISW